MFHVPLEFIGSDNARAARRALPLARARARSCGEWKPKLVLTHNDLWKGNILFNRCCG